MPTAADRRRFVVASCVGAVVAFGAWAWMLLAGRADVLVREAYGNFYDAQARALLDRHWDVSAVELGWEGFLIHGKTFTYFGPWPALLRMPFIHFAPSTYGRLTQLSMLLAFAVFLFGVVALHARIRELLRPAAPMGRGETVLAAAVPLVLGLGSSAFFLASRAWVYHEAILWGAAWSILAYERILAFTMRPTGWRLAGASLTATLAFASRASVGLGPVVALGLVLAGQLLRALRARGRDREPSAGDAPRGDRLLGRLDWLGVRHAEPDGAGAERRWIGGLLAAVAVPAVTYMYVNWARFGSLTTVPWRRQLLFKYDAVARAPLEANDGSYFSIKYLPTALLQYVRPDALAPNGLFPWVTYPRFRTPVIGDVLINQLDFSSSVTASMLGLTILTALGVVGALWSRRFARTEEAARLRVILVGAAIGVLLVLTIAFIAQRYLGDWLPFVAIGGIAGMHVLLHRRESGAGSRRRATVAVAVVSVLAVAGIWVNGSLAIMYQRLINPAEARQRVGMLDLQYRVAGALGTGAPQADFLRALPSTPGRAGTVAVVGDCGHLYWSSGKEWSSVGGTPEGGVVRLRVTYPPASDRTWHPLVSWRTPNGPQVIALRRDGDVVKLARGVPNAEGGLDLSDAISAAIDVGSAREHDVVVTLARPLNGIEVGIDGRSALALGGQHDLPSEAPVVGRSDAAGTRPEYGADIRELPPDTGLCDRIRDARG